MHNLFHSSSQTIYEEGGCHHGVFGISVASGSRRECSVSEIKVARKGSPPQPGISDGLPYLHAGPKKHLTKHCQRHNGPRLDFVSRFIFRACFHLVRNLANLAIRLRNLGKPSIKKSHVSMDTFRTPLSPPPRVYGRLGGSFF